MKQEWRCTKCGALLGKFRQVGIEIEYKKVTYVAEGIVSTHCRKCHTFNTAESTMSSTVPRRG